MRRHGWAFSLGLLVGGTAAAQPPAGSGHSPPPPDLPGVVVAQTTGDKPLVKPDVPPFTDRAPKADPAKDPAPLPLNGAPPAPDFPAAPPVAAITTGPAVPCPAPVAAPISEKRGIGSIQEWLHFRSQARQSGHYPTPYYPPLHTWFTCEPRRPPCLPCHVPATLPVPGAVVVPPGATVITPGPVAPPPPVDAPVGPPQACCPVAPPAPEGDVLLGFKKVGDGLNFSPGVAPMAGPTKQVHRVSHWRPK